MILGYVIFALIPVAIVSFIVYLPYMIYSNKKYGKQPFFWHLAKYSLIGYIISLLYLTIFWMFPYIDFTPEYRFLNLKPFIWVKECYTMGWRKMTEQLLLNIAMFVPYGLILPIAVRKMRGFVKCISVILLTTVSIETIQFFIGRSADIDDVIMNLAGGIIGYMLFFIFSRLFENRNWRKNMTGSKTYAAITKAK